jgi:hypothetical protein
MITIVCDKCKYALRVNGEVRDVDSLVGQASEYWPDKYSCYNCGATAVGYLTPEVSPLVFQTLIVTDVNPDEAFAALNGLGVPAERTCCEEVILPYFEQVGLRVKGKQLRGQTRYILEELTFPDGTRMQVGPSPQGAVIYRIVKPHSYVSTMKETLDV